MAYIKNRHSSYCVIGINILLYLSKKQNEFFNVSEKGTYESGSIFIFIDRANRIIV